MPNYLIMSHSFQKMFRRKLTALEYPGADKFDVKSVVQFRNLVSWLEDQKIREGLKKCSK